MLLEEINPLYNDPNFKSWFKGSKVVDEHGNPLRMYHGSNADIVAFNHEYIGQGKDQFGPGFYYTSYPHTASGYADINKDHATVYPVYLNIKKPLDATLRKRLTKLQVRAFMVNSPILEEALSNYGDIEYEGYTNVFNEALNNMFDYQEDTLLKTLHLINNDFYPNHDKEFLYAVTKILKYDGVKVIHPDGEIFYVAFYPSQIKSIFSKFSKKSENIGESVNVHLHM